jgi:Sec-independent protein translocase protein TatA
MTAAAAPLAFVSTGELVVVVVIGLLLFGGDLPRLLKDFGKVWVKMRRSVNEFKRESGIDEAMTEIRRQTDFRLEEPRWRREMDHAAGPARAEPPQETQVSSEQPAAPDAPQPSSAPPLPEPPAAPPEKPAV